MNPLAQRIGTEAAQQRRNLRCAFGVARGTPGRLRSGVMFMPPTPARRNFFH